jgi:hypothetical protein
MIFLPQENMSEINPLELIEEVLKFMKNEKENYPYLTKYLEMGFNAAIKFRTKT